MNSKYILIKHPRTKEAVYINYSPLQGFKFSPNNNHAGIRVNSLILIKPSFIEKILKKKIKRKLNMYLQHFINTIDENEDDATNLRIVLDDLEKFKRQLQNKYRNYLDQKYMMLLKRKIELLENEIKNKMIELTLNNYNQVQEEEELSRRR